MKKIVFVIVLSLFLPYFTFAADPAQTAMPTAIIRPSVRISNPLSGELQKEFYPFPENSPGLGVNIATADLNNDGYQEIIVAAGRNEEPLVKIFNYQGELQSQFLAYDQNYKGGLKAIAANLVNDNDQVPEIITAPLEEGNTQIEIFTASGQLINSFYAIDDKATGGANISAGDVNEDGKAEIVVGAGYGQEPLIKIFDNLGHFIKAFYAFRKDFTEGVNVLAADLNNDGNYEIIAAPTSNHSPEVRIFDYDGNLVKTFLAYQPGFGGGVNLASADIDNDGQTEIFTGAGFSGGSHVRFFDSDGNNKLNPKFFAFDNFKGGLSIAGTDINHDKQTELIAATQTISPLNKYSSAKLIEIDLAKQKLYAYFKGDLVNKFTISTGKNKFPTPQGTYKIMAKLPKTNMVRNYGPNNPENYNLPDVPNVMYFYHDYAIHGAYWHWKFGTRVSHGCVNLKLPDAKWLYDWTPIFTPVNIYSSKA